VSGDEIDGSAGRGAGPSGVARRIASRDDVPGGVYETVQAIASTYVVETGKPLATPAPE